MTTSSIVAQSVCTSNELFETQIALEKESVEVGISRMTRLIERGKQAKMESVSAGSRKMIKTLIDPLTEGIRETLDKIENGKAHHLRKVGTNSGTFYHHLRYFKPEVLAYMTLKVCFNEMAVSPKLHSISSKLGSYLEDELYCDEVKAHNKYAYHHFIELAKTYTRHRHKHEFLANYNENTRTSETPLHTPWGSDVKIRLGLMLIDILISHTGAFQTRTMRVNKNKTDTFLVVNSEVLEWIEKENEFVKTLMPQYWPTVIPPKPWTGMFGGGYHSNHIKPLQLIRTDNRQYVEDLKGFKLTQVLKALNIVQETKWSINTDVLDVMNEVWERDLMLGDLPPRVRLKPNPCPIDSSIKKEDMTEEQRIKFDEWRVYARDIYNSELENKTKRIQTNILLQVANRFKEYDAIYFPHTLDFRGRMYPTPVFLNPQGTDRAKSLLRFSEGIAITEPEHASWLAIHGANCWGEDKVDFDARIDWVADNIDWILKIAEDPLENREWSDADEPFQFLAWCFEWFKFESEGYGFVSHLPISVDGSCNGIQHFSAMLRDAEGGRAVNLIPQDKPSDIYGIVADNLNESLSKIPEDHEDYEKAQTWLRYGIDRTLTKRPVMVQPYGGTMQSCVSYIREHVQDQTKDYIKEIFKKDASKIADYHIFLGGYLWNSIVKAIPQARIAMDWLKNMASVCSKNGLPMMWVTPSGFPVCQKYNNFTKRRIKTHLQGRVYSPIIYSREEDTIASRRQRQGIAPNFVHSMDASALCLYVIKAKEEYGINNFMMVHDSYGTHAAQTVESSQALREAFVDMYSQQDVLREIYDDVVALLSTKNPKAAETLPEPPEMGSLNIFDVLDSPFFFA